MFFFKFLKFKKYTLDFQDNYIVIKRGDADIKKILYNEISTVLYNIDSEGYWFNFIDIIDSGLHFFNKFVKYRIEDEEQLIERVKSKQIILVPNFGWYTRGNGVIEYCKMEKKYFLTITRICTTTTPNQDSLFALNYANIDRTLRKIPAKTC